MILFDMIELPGIIFPYGGKKCGNSGGISILFSEGQGTDPGKTVLPDIIIGFA